MSAERVFAALLLVSSSSFGQALLAGDKDDFTFMFDDFAALVQRPELDVWLARPSGPNAMFQGGAPRPFDLVSSINWEFGYSFLALPSLSNPTLELRLMGSPSLRVQNDTISLQFDSAFAFAWSRSIADLCDTGFLSNSLVETIGQR